jgi:hypothetical protein
VDLISAVDRGCLGNDGPREQDGVPLIDTGLPAPVSEPVLGRSTSYKERKRSKLGLLPLVALIFYEVSGGPFGTEVLSVAVHPPSAAHVQGLHKSNLP